MVAEPEPRPSEATRPESSPNAAGLDLRWLLAALAVAVGLGVVVFVWQALPRTPGDNSVEAGFLRDMDVHHDQAVEMAMVIRDRTEDELLWHVSRDMALTQQGQIGMMRAWLEVWDLPLTGTELPMAWMDHPVTGRMPGMASAEEVRQLAELPIEEAEEQFLRLMIRHHQGGVLMAEALLERSDERVVRRLAQSIIDGQQAEIDAMNQMLINRGLDPITNGLEMTTEDENGHGHDES